MVVWNTAGVGSGGEVSMFAKIKMDVDIKTIKIANFDETRYTPFFSVGTR